MGGEGTMGEQGAAAISTESVLRAVLESPRDILILASDREHRYLAFNEAHRRVAKHRLGVDIAIGMNLLELIPEPVRSRSRANIERALAGEQVHLVEEVGVGTPLQKHYFEITHCPIYGPDGTVIGQTAFHIDITAERRLRYELELHRAELEKLVAERTAALRRSEELYRTLVQNAPVAVLVHRDDELLFVNPAAVALCGERDGDSLLARRLGEMVEPAVVTGEGPTHGERVLRTGSGDPIDVEWTSLGVEFQDEKATLSLAVDVSSRKRAEAERRKLEEQMRETQKLESLGVLAGGIAHDFNNLLVGIMGNADLALGGLKAEGRHPDLPVQLHRIKTASLRAAELTGQLLAYAGKGRFVIRPIDLNELAREMADLTRVSVPKWAELVLELAPSLPAFEGDIAQIRQIVMNLIMNGAESLIGSAGRITLRTSVVSVRPGASPSGVDGQVPPGRYVCLEVTDTGAGMDNATKTKIFDPFFTTKTSGRGLGLAAVLGIVRAHEGAIGVTSAVGSGSTVRVLIPCSDRPLAVTKPVPSPEEWRATGTVLIADDEPRVRQVLAMMLRDIGFEVLEASSATTCLEMFRQRARTIDALLVDLEMPGGGGREVVRVLRAEGHQVPILISSGYNEEVVGQELRADGRLSFLEKPFEYAMFVHTLKGALAVA